MTCSTHRQLLDAGAHRLREAEGGAREDPRREATLLLQAAVGADRTRLLTDADEAVAYPDVARFWEMVGERSRGVPLSLIVGETSFHEIELFVEAGVFIPRPETELLVEEGRRALHAAMALRPGPGPAGGPRRMTLLDLCTGTGAVAIATAAAFRYRPDVSVYGGDWNPRAVRLARRNAARNDLSDRVDVRRSDLFSAFADLEGKVDVLLSNPPYIAPAEADSLPLEVRVGDPAEALYDPDGGTGFHSRIARRGLDFLRPGGTLAMEMGETQGDELRGRLEGLGYEEVRVLRDLAGRERFVRGLAPATRPG